MKEKEKFNKADEVKRLSLRSSICVYRELDKKTSQKKDAHRHRAGEHARIRKDDKVIEIHESNLFYDSTTTIVYCLIA